MVAFAENKIPRTACSKLPQHLRGLDARLVEKSIYRDDLETENYYVRNRCYSPALGRWLTRDPIGTQGGINLYAYVGSSPVGNVDAWGLWYTTVLGPIGPVYDLGLGGCVIAFEHIVTPSWYNDIFGSPRTRTYYTYYPLGGEIAWTALTCRPGFPGTCFTDTEMGEIEKDYANAMIVEMGLEALRSSQYTEIEDAFFGIAGGGTSDAGADSLSAGISGAGGVYGVSH
jgi:RHS repeat-associated protein